MGLAPYLSSQLKQEAISTALTLTKESERAEALVALAPHLPDGWKMKALNSAREMLDPVTKVRALSGLLSALPKKERADALNEALTLTHEMPPLQRADGLISLLPHIPKELQSQLLDEVLSAARSSPNWREQIPVFTSIALTQQPNKQLATLMVALDLVAEIKEENERGEALITLALASPPDLHSMIVNVAQALKDPRIKSRVVIQLQGIFQQEPTRLAPSEPKAPSFQDATSSQPADQYPSSRIESKPDQPVIEIPEMGFGPSEGVSPPAPPPEPQQAKAKQPRSKVQRKKPAKTEAPAIEQPTESPLLSESVGAKTYLHSDKWATEDWLNYSLYAKAIAEFITHDDTHPPLAIGVLAPWGQGKTTLVNLIKEELIKKEVKKELKAKALKDANQGQLKDPLPLEPVAASGKLKAALGKLRVRLVKKEPEVRLQRQASNREDSVSRPPVATFASLKKWLENPGYRFKPQKLNHPIVWFNAWKYQNSEQVWAGMASCILSQLVEQIGSEFEGERFWLALQAERLDFNAVRQDIHRIVFERVVPWIAIWAVIAVAGLLAFSFGAFTGLEAWSRRGMAAVTVSLFMTLVHWLVAKMKVDKKPLEGKFAQYVRQPNYTEKLGFFHEVEQDVRRVFDLLVDKNNPAVVFVDDLDRCSPGTVAQVIEAMNLFLSGDFPNCYFVMGMDAQVVAASMEVAYETLDKKLKSVTRSYGSLGWYFMDKFIQLQFSIPNMTSGQRKSYIARLFGQDSDKGEAVTPEVLDTVQKRVEEKLDSPTLKSAELGEQAREVAKLFPRRPNVAQRLSETIIEKGAEKLSDDSPAIQKYLKIYEPYLGASPRGMKRFANLYRFYHLTQLSRQSQGLPACSASALARWLVIMLRWPQVVRYIQWESEARLSAGNSAVDKATALEKNIFEAKTHKAWVTRLKKFDPDQLEWWLRDQELYEFLKGTANADGKLSLAVETGVW